MNKYDWFINNFRNEQFYDEQVEIFNDFCNESGLEKKIYSMKEFNELFSNKKPYDIFHLVWVNTGDVDWTDKYFMVTGDVLNTHTDPFEFMRDYIRDIYNHTHIWETKLNLDDYIEDMYDGHFDLKPKDMDSDKFYDIVENAVNSNEREVDIVDDIKKAVSEN